MKIKLGLGKLNIEEINEYTNGTLYNFKDEDVYITHICTDSREADENTLFVATRGEKVDGHDYIKAASEKGCAAFVCEYVPSDVCGMKLAFSVVENSINAFSAIASNYSERHKMRNVAVTGSVGKTTTKELIQSVLKTKYDVYATSGNFNSVIGMPMSLMEAESNKEVGVFEMGMSGFSEIKLMSMAAKPYIGLITNIGSSHLEYLGSRENIRKAKLEIAAGIEENGYLLLNGDEVLLKNAKDITKRDNINYLYLSPMGNKNADAYLSAIRLYKDKSEFDVVFGDRVIKDVLLNAPGFHVASNALFACVVGCLMGLSTDDIKRGIAGYNPIGDRQRIYEKNNVTVIADSYNAAPESMRAAIDVLDNIDCNKKIAVLGDMKELGVNSKSLHMGVGEYLKNKVDILFTYGEYGKYIADGLISCGSFETAVYSYSIGEEEMLCQKIKECLHDGDCILFKASRSMALEKIIKGTDLD